MVHIPKKKPTRIRIQFHSPAMYFIDFMKTNTTAKNLNNRNYVLLDKLKWNFTLIDFSLLVDLFLIVCCGCCTNTFHSHHDDDNDDDDIIDICTQIDN